MHRYRPATAYNITTSASSAQGNAVSAGITTLRLVALTTPAYVRMGTNPTAVVGDTLVPVNYPVFIQVLPGETPAAISTGAGILNVTECP